MPGNVSLKPNKKKNILKIAIILPMKEISSSNFKLHGVRIVLYLSYCMKNICNFIDKTLRSLELL